MLFALYLVLGLLCAGIGGEVFLRGAVGLAARLRVPAGVIGATVAAFATSSPEVAVAIMASAEGRPQISLGDALGSNVVNIGLVMGVALVISATRASHAGIRRDVFMCVLAPIATALLAADGNISRFDAVLLTAMFIVWLVTIVRTTIRIPDDGGVVDLMPRHWRIGALLSVGLGFLVLAGRLIVLGARGIGEQLGMDPFVIGATMVSVGTSVPELATTVIAKLRGHHDVALGTVLGSNLFNGLFIVSLAATICPIDVHWQDIAASLGFGIVVVAAAIPPSSGILRRSRGFVMLALYASYVGVMLWLGPSH